MGHLTLISEDVISALEHYPDDLTAILGQYAPQPAWDQYVNGSYLETKKRDTSLLGGGKPVIAPGTGFPRGRWAKVDEEDPGVNGLCRPPNKSEAIPMVATSAFAGEFRRMAPSSTIPTNTATFGPSQEDEDAAGPAHVSRLCLGVGEGGCVRH